MPAELIERVHGFDPPDLAAGAGAAAAAAAGAYTYFTLGCALTGACVYTWRMILRITTCWTGCAAAATGFGEMARAPQGAAKATPPVSQAAARRARFDQRRDFLGPGLPASGGFSVVIVLVELVLGLGLV
jgi:hypothetical protein